MTAPRYTKRDLIIAPWHGTPPFTLPKGTRCRLIKGADGLRGDLWAVDSIKLLADLSGNSHDPKYRYAFIDASELESKS